MLKSQEVALDLAAFLEVAGKCLQGRQHTPIKKKKREETCLVMEFLSFQQDPHSISHNYGQLSYGNYKDPCAVKTRLVPSHQLYGRPETPAPSPFLPGMAKSRLAPGLLYLDPPPQSNAACTSEDQPQGRDPHPTCH